MKVKEATTAAEIFAAGQLIYKCYQEEGLTIEPTFNFPLRVFISYDNSTVFSTVSLIEDIGILPADTSFHDELYSLRQTARISQIGFLANQNKKASLVKLFQCMIAIAKSIVDVAVIITHPSHAHFYQKVCAFELIGNERQYSVGKPGVLMSLDLHNLQAHKNYEKFFK